MLSDWIMLNLLMHKILNLVFCLFIQHIYKASEIYSSNFLVAGKYSLKHFNDYILYQNMYVS